MTTRPNGWRPLRRSELYTVALDELPATINSWLARVFGARGIAVDFETTIASDAEWTFFTYRMRSSDYELVVRVPTHAVVDAARANTSGLEGPSKPT